MLFDSHAHLNDERFDEDREELISSLNEKGVDLVVNPGACMKTSAESVELANKYDFIYAAVGVHPHDVKDLTEEDVYKRQVYTYTIWFVSFCSQVIKYFNCICKTTF